MKQSKYYRTRIKMCGIKTPEDAIYAANIGVDAVGLVFYEKSPRYLSLQEAKSIIKVLPAFVSVVGLFYNANQKQVAETISSIPLDLLQFHGTEAPEFCASFNKPYIKAIPMLSDINLSEYIEKYKAANAYMLDSMTMNEAGGTGKTFDWSIIPTDLQDKIILAGGLKDENVADAIQQTRCYAVDVSSGIESSRGIKDTNKMLSFVKEVSRANKEINEK